MTRLWQFSGGLKLAGCKSLACTSPVTPLKLPPLLTLPLCQHQGEEENQAVVQIGEKVLKGQVIAHSTTQNPLLAKSAPIHASSSGTVVAIEQRAIPNPLNLEALCIVIETDGQETWTALSPLPDYTELSPMIVREQIAKAGIVGLGGAGFPTHLKLQPEGIETLIINGTECEPYIACDACSMQQYPQDILAGTHILCHVLGGVKRCIIAIEDNKPLAYQALSALAPKEIEVVPVPTLYPMGGERQLIKVLTGLEIGYPHWPMQLGIVVHNVETVRAIYRAIHFGQPLISRMVTITGSGVTTPQNREVLLGTPINMLLDQCGRKPDIEYLVMGGEMMGFTLPTDELPVIKTTNCLIAYTNETIKPPPTMPCIRCGACAQVCPMNLLPQQLYWYAKAKDFKKLQDYSLFDCIECGCCVPVCPSHIALVDYYRYAKSAIRTQQQERVKANHARQRYKFRLSRLEREQLEREQHHQQKTSVGLEDKQAVVKAALERARMKKQP